MANKIVKEVLKTLLILFMVALTTLTTLFAVVVGNYISRGFPIPTAIEWTVNDYNEALKEQGLITERHKERAWVPMANANIEW